MNSYWLSVFFTVLLLSVSGTLCQCPLGHHHGPDHDGAHASVVMKSKLEVVQNSVGQVIGACSSKSGDFWNCVFEELPKNKNVTDIWAAIINAPADRVWDAEVVLGEILNSNEHPETIKDLVAFVRRQVLVVTKKLPLKFPEFLPFAKALNDTVNTLSRKNILSLKDNVLSLKRIFNTKATEWGFSANLNLTAVVDDLVQCPHFQKRVVAFLGTLKNEDLVLREIGSRMPAEDNKVFLAYFDMEPNFATGLQSPMISLFVMFLGMLFFY